MKKIIIISAFLFLATGSFAQYKPFVFGLRLGGDLAWLRPDTKGYSNEGMRAGITWGFIADYYFLENYAVETGFNVNFITGKLQYPDSIGGIRGTTERKYNFKYLQIPLCLKLKTSNFEKVNFYGKIGLGTAFRISTKAEDTFTSMDQQTTIYKEDITSKTIFIRESLILGGGIEYMIKGSTVLFAEIIFDNGLTDQLKGNAPTYPYPDQKANQNFLELAIGVVF